MTSFDTINKMVKFKEVPPVKASFMQAIGLGTYIFLAGSFMSHAEKGFNPEPKWIAPMIFLTFFSFSALICGSLALSYPAWLIWEKKNVFEAIQVVVYTALWLLAIFLIFLGISLVA